jgi:hypothetical protein
MRESRVSQVLQADFSITVDVRMGNAIFEPIEAVAPVSRFLRTTGAPGT